MVIEIDRTKWELPSNRLSQRHHSAEKQAAIKTQVDALLKLGVIEKSRATHWSQVHPVLKSPGKWRLTLDFVRLNAATGGLEGWPIPHIQIEKKLQLLTIGTQSDGLKTKHVAEPVLAPEQFQMGWLFGDSEPDVLWKIIDPITEGLVRISSYLQDGFLNHNDFAAELNFDDVKVPVKNRIGEEGQGFYYLMGGLQLERLTGSIMGYSSCENILEYSLKYMSERKAFGRTIDKFQVLRHRVAQLATEIEACNQFVYSVCRLHAYGQFEV
jgi:hypothetical protein